MIARYGRAQLSDAEGGGRLRRVAGTSVVIQAGREPNASRLLATPRRMTRAFYETLERLGLGPLQESYDKVLRSPGTIAGARKVGLRRWRWCAMGACRWMRSARS